MDNQAGRHLHADYLTIDLLISPSRGAKCQSRSHPGGFPTAKTHCPLLSVSLAKVSASSAHLLSRRCRDMFCSFLLTAFLCSLSVPTPSPAAVGLPGPTAPPWHRRRCHCPDGSGGGRAGGEKPSVATGRTLQVQENMKVRTTFSSKMFLDLEYCSSH